jgi:hypothetical protein
MQQIPTNSRRARVHNDSKQVWSHSDDLSQEEEDDEINNPLYYFEPLEGPDKIRILELHPAIERHSNLEISIRQIDYWEGGYQALSYVWGSEDRPFRAGVRGKTGSIVGSISLTENLKNALLDLRDCTKLEKKIFWIDQLCIDQDATEKNHQVQLIGQIYRNAIRVITYIGPAAAPDIEERGIRLVQQLYAHFKSTCDLLLDWGDIFNAWPRRKELPVLSLPDYLERDESPEIVTFWKWLAELAFGEWTMRLWIVQEQLLNKEIIVLRGPRLLLWDAVVAMPILFCLNILPAKYREQYWNDRSSKSISPHGAIASSVYQLWRCRRVQIIQHPESNQSYQPMETLLSNLCFYRGHECRDSRDRIYALLAISSDRAELDITLDYSDANLVNNVYIHVSRLIIQRSNRLAVLNGILLFGNSSEVEYPSWALNSSRPPDSHHVNITPTGLRPHPRIQLTGPRVFLENRVLVLRGRIVDYIFLSTPVQSYNRSYMMQSVDESGVEILSRLLAGWVSMLSTESTNLNPEKIHALAQTSIADPTWPITQEDDTPNSRMKKALFSFWCRLRESWRSLYLNSTKLGIDQSTLIYKVGGYINAIAPLVLDSPQMSFKFSPGTALNAQERQAAADFRDRITKRGRCLGFTIGKRFCNGMNEIQKGDAVAALQGSFTLWILRPVGNKRYRIIGDAYVYGLMQGEAYKNVDPDAVDYDIEIV